MTDIAGIREKEKQSHITLYENAVLFETGSWLQKPVQTVLDLLPHFQNNTSLRVLDLGCGVGRNCLAIAKQFQTIDCKIVCLDILDTAIEKLFFYAQQYGLSSMIHGIVGTIDDFSIPKDTYDWILAISALEHVHSKDCFLQKLMEIRDGIRHNGVVCLILNSDVQETDSITGEILPA